MQFWDLDFCSQIIQYKDRGPKYLIEALLHQGTVHPPDSGSPGSFLKASVIHLEAPASQDDKQTSFTNFVYHHREMI